MSVFKRLGELGFDCVPADVRSGSFPFHSAVKQGNLVFTSGQIPILGDEQVKGKVGADLTVEEAQRAAALCAVNCLRAIAAVADVDRVERVVKLLGMVNVAPGFNDTSSVINGASQLLLDVFGEKGFHARSAVGMVLPGDWAVEVELVVALI